MLQAKVLCNLVLKHLWKYLKDFENVFFFGHMQERQRSSNVKFSNFEQLLKTAF